MAFGVTLGTTGAVSRNANTTAQVAYQLSSTGVKTDATTYSTETQETEEFYVSGSTAPTNPVTDGQNGTTVSTGFTITESNTDYAKYSVTKVKLPTSSNS